MFYVNQVMRFGKLIAVVQPNPADANSSIATVMIALAVSLAARSTSKKKYQDVPVLRNLVPSQVLLGNSSFNTGNSLSAGLPSLRAQPHQGDRRNARSRLIAITPHGSNGPPIRRAVLFDARTRAAKQLRLDVPMRDEPREINHNHRLTPALAAD